MGIKESMANFFGPKVEKKKKEKKAEDLDLPEYILDMPEGSAKERAIKVHRVNQKKKDKYACGGVKYSKLRKLVKGKKD